MGQCTELQVGSLEVGFEETCLIEIRILKVTLSHVSFLQPRLVKVAVFGDDAQQVYALHGSADEVAFADVSRTKRSRAQVALAEVTLDQNGLVEADFGRLAVIHVTASHVRIIQAHIAQIDTCEPQTRHLQRLNGRVDNLQELSHSQLCGIPLSNLI